MPVPKYDKRVHKLLDTKDAAPRSGSDYIKVPKNLSRWSKGGKQRSVGYKKMGASGKDRVVEENSDRIAQKRAKKNKRRATMVDYIKGKAKTLTAMRKMR